MMLLQPNDLSSSSHFLQAMKSAGYITQLMRWSAIVFPEGEPAGLPEYIEIKGPKEKQIQAIKDVSNTADKSGKKVILDLGTGHSIAPISCALKYPDAICIGVDEDPDKLNIKTLSPAPPDQKPKGQSFALAAKSVSSRDLIQQGVKADIVTIFHPDPYSEKKIAFDGYLLAKPGGKVIIVLDTMAAKPEEVVSFLLLNGVAASEIKTSIMTVDELNQQFGYFQAVFLDPNRDPYAYPTSGFITEDPNLPKKVIFINKKPKSSSFQVPGYKQERVYHYQPPPKRLSVIPRSRPDQRDQRVGIYRRYIG